MKSKQLPIEENKDIESTKAYCRKCEKIKIKSAFLKSTDSLLDGNGLMSICKDCVHSIYKDILREENFSIQKTIHRMCRMLNILYHEPSIEGALNQMEGMKSDEDKIFGFYCSNLILAMKKDMKGGADAISLTYIDSPIINMNDAYITPESVDEEVVRFWGKGRKPEEYQWFESRMDDWKSTHKCDTTAEEVLFKFIVLQEFEIETTSSGKAPPVNMVKNLQDLMKTASVDPSKANAASAGKGHDAYSNFIKIIETEEPAEYFEDKTLFKDFDDIGKKYFIPYVVRAIKNFVTGSKDFNVDKDESDNDFDDINETDDEDINIGDLLNMDSDEEVKNE